MSKTHMFWGGLFIGSGIWAQQLWMQILLLIFATVIVIHGQRVAQKEWNYD